MISTKAATGLVVVATVAPTAGGAMAQVFNEMMLMMGIMGGLGGLLFALLGNVKLRQVIRNMATGAITAAGLGEIAPWLAARVFDLDLSDGAARPATMAGIAFLVGFAQERLLTWILDVEKPNGGRNGQQ